MMSFPRKCQCFSILLICSVGVCAFWYIYLIHHFPYELYRKASQEKISPSRDAFSKQIANQTPSIDEPRLIIIVAYLHSGSSYIGTLFQKQPGSFYEYEPLRSLLKETLENDTALYLNGTTRKLSGHVLDAELAAQYIENMLKCKHGHLDLTTLIQYFSELDSDNLRDSSSFFKCQGRPRFVGNPDPVTAKKQRIMKKLYYTPESQEKVQKCLPYLTNNCKKAKIHVSKFIRIGLDTAGILVKKIPQLKVIHLFRDPRSMMDSIMRKKELGTKKVSGFDLQSKRLCARMRTDITMRKLFHENYPGNVMGIRYEDFTRAPMEATKTLFKFTGLVLDKSVMKFVRETSLYASKNSTVREGVWRTHMDQTYLSIVNVHCSDVMKDLGYIIYYNISDIKKYDMPTCTHTRYTTFVPLNS